MSTLHVTGDAQLRCTVVHPSGASLTTQYAAPGEAGADFSPTDTLAAALGSCMLTSILYATTSKGIATGEITVTVDKTMADSRIPRLARLAVHVHVPRALSAEDKRRVERAAGVCPVHAALGPDVEAPVTFSYGDAHGPESL